MTSLSLSYPFTLDSVSAAVEQYRGLGFSTPTEYRESTKAIAACRDIRLAIEERRKLLKADSLAYGKEVDRVARLLIERVEAVESGLKGAKKQVDDAKALAKREAAMAEERRIESEVRAKREAEEAVLTEARKAEHQRIESERAQLAEERKMLDAERSEREREAADQRKQIESQRAELEAVRAETRKQREATDALARSEQAKRDAEERAARLAAEAEEQRLNALEYEAARQRRIAALQPDKEKLRAVAGALRHIAENEKRDTTLDSKEAQIELDHALGTVIAAAALLEQWQP